MNAVFHKFIEHLQSHKALCKGTSVAKKTLLRSYCARSFYENCWTFVTPTRWRAQNFAKDTSSKKRVEFVCVSASAFVFVSALLSFSLFLIVPLISLPFLSFFFCCLCHANDISPCRLIAHARLYHCSCLEWSTPIFEVARWSTLVAKLAVVTKCSRYPLWRRCTYKI